MKRQWNRVLAMALSAALLLPSIVVPTGAQGTEGGSTVWDREIANPTAEENTGNMNRIPFNNEDAVMDLEAGTWAAPAVMDYDGDGILDLVVVGTAVCYSGTYVFYGDENSKDTLLMSKGDQVAGGVGNFYPSYFYEEIEDGGKYT